MFRDQLLLLNEKEEGDIIRCPCGTAVCLHLQPVLAYNGPHQIVPDLMGPHKIDGPDNMEKGYSVDGGSRLMSGLHNTPYVLCYY